MIQAYRKDASGRIEKYPTFEVPVYLMVPHHSLKDGKNVDLRKDVRGFGVDKSFVRVPEGTTLVRIHGEVNVAQSSDECNGVVMSMQHGVNVLASEGVLLNCGIDGKPGNGRRVYDKTYFRPPAGLWNFDAFGIYWFDKTKYNLKVDFVKVEHTLAKDLLLATKPEETTGKFNMLLADKSYEIKPDVSKSMYAYYGFGAQTSVSVKTGEAAKIKSPEGLEYKVYSSDVLGVIVDTTVKNKSSDVDVVVYECEFTGSAEAPVVDSSTCQVKEQAMTASGDEHVEFYVEPDYAYAIEIQGYDTGNAKETVQVKTVQYMKNIEKGSLSFAEKSKNDYDVSYALDYQNSAMLKDARYTSKKYFIEGVLRVIGENKEILVNAMATVKNGRDEAADGEQKPDISSVFNAGLPQIVKAHLFNENIYTVETINSDKKEEAKK